MITIDPNKPIPCALFDLRPLMNPAAWSLLTALIENEYNDCQFLPPGPLTIETLAEMTSIDEDKAGNWLWWMGNNSFIPVNIDFETDLMRDLTDNPEPRYRLNLNKNAQCFERLAAFNEADRGAA
jgi:hypothetical protein